MNILITAPQYYPTPKHYEFPLGLAYISAILKEQNFNVFTLNLNHKHNIPQIDLLKEYINTNNIDIFCTGGLITHYSIIEKLLTDVRQIKPDSKIILGGGIVTCEPELMIEELDFDYGVLGEGELTIVELINTLLANTDLNNVNGIIFKNDNNEFVITEQREYLKDLNSLPMPDYEGFDIEYYLDNQLPNDEYYMNAFDDPRVLPVASSRSCPYLCTFCYHPLGNKYRRREIEDFIEEVKYLKEKYKINGLSVVDELIASSKSRLKKFCQAIKELNIRWTAQLRVNCVDRDLLIMMKDAGCYYISYGLESANNDILRSMNKHTTIEQLEKALAITYELGIGIQGNFLFSDRNETYETAADTLIWWLQHKYYNINLTMLRAYPYSSDYQYALENGLILDKLQFIKQGCPPLKLNKIPQDKFNNILSVISQSWYSLHQFPVNIKVVQQQANLIRQVYTYYIEADCPHCNSTNHYHNIHFNAIGFNHLSCKYCNQRFHTSPAWFDHFKEYMPQFQAISNKSQMPKVLTDQAITKGPVTPSTKAPLSDIELQDKTISTNNKNRAFCILLPDSNFYAQITESLIQTFTKKNIKAVKYPIPGIVDKLLTYVNQPELHNFLIENQITDVFTINVLRSQINTPKHIQHHNWIQDYFGIPKESNHNRNDKFWSMVHYWPSQYSIGKFLPPASHFDKYYKPPKEENEYEYEIGLTFNYIGHEIMIENDNCDEIENHIQHLLDIIHQRAIDLNCFMGDFDTANHLLKWAEIETGIFIPNKNLRKELVHHIAVRVLRNALRVELVDNLINICKKKKWKLKICGHAWDFVDKYNDYYIKHIDNNEELAAFMQKCKVIIHANGDTNIHIRAIESLACGSFCIAKAHSSDHLSNGLRSFISEDLLPTYSNHKELEKILDYYIDQKPEERKSNIVKAKAAITNFCNYDRIADSLLDNYCFSN